jgi:hypothetical protein
LEIACSDIAALRDRLPAGGRVAQRIMPRYFWDATPASEMMESNVSIEIDGIL